MIAANIRRRVVPTAAALAVLALAGCSSAGGSSSQSLGPITDPVAGEVEPGLLEGITITFAGDGGTTQEGQREAAWAPFAQESGATILEDSPALLAKIQAQVQSDNIQWDFISTSDYIIAQYCGELFEPLDTEQLDLSHIPEGSSSECGVPSISYGLVLVYNTERYADNPPQGWADFFDPQRFPGKRAIYGSPEPYAPIIEAAAIANGKAADEPFAIEHLGPALELLGSIRDDSIYWETGAESQQMLESGEADMAAVWTGRVLVATKNGAHYTPVWNDWFFIIDQMAMVKGTKNPTAVYAAMNYYLGEKQQARFAELTSYSPLHSEAKPRLDEATSQFIVTTPERQATATRTNLEFWGSQENMAAAQEGWTSLVAGG